MSAQECKANFVKKSSSKSNVARAPDLKELASLLAQQRRDRKLRQTTEGRDRLQLRDAKKSAAQNDNQGDSGNARDVLDYLLGQ